MEVIPNHDYENSRFLKSTDKTKIIEIRETGEESIKKSSDTVEIKDTPQVCWLGKFITLSAKQEDIVEDTKYLPLIVSGSAGSGKTSVALEKFRKIEGHVKGKVLYITQSENLIKQSKELYEYVYWDEIADEFKIGIPDRIEFLSLHEFLEKQAEDIKGKTPIDRNKFFSWFNKVCKKDKFKNYAKDGDKIFEEFTAVIAGGNLSKGNYNEGPGDRQAIFPQM